MKQKIIRLLNDCGKSLSQKEPYAIEKVIYDCLINNKLSVEQEQELFKEFPKQFINAVRASQIFIKNKDKLEQLLSMELTGFEAHQSMWKYLNEEEHFLWKKIQKNLEDVLKMKPEVVLSELIFWLEYQRFNKGVDLWTLSNIYNFFIRLYLHNHPFSLAVNATSFNQTFNSLLIEKIKKKKEINPNVSNLLTSIDDWIDFDDRLLQAYSFDWNTNPVEKNGFVSLTYNPEIFYKNQLNLSRYAKYEIDYYLQAKERVKEKVKEKNIPNDILNIKQKYIHYAIQEEKLKLILNDISALGIEYAGEKDGLLKAYRILLYLSAKSLFDYDYLIGNIKSNNWLDAYKKYINYLVSKGRKKSINYPFLFMNYSGFVKEIEPALLYESKFIKKTLSLFSYEIDKQKPFNRFANSYDVRKKPIIKLDDFYFVPLMFLANNDFYSLTNVALDILAKNNRQRKLSSEAMEQNLAKFFKEQDFKVERLNDKEANKIEGDVDIIVEDDNTVLFIQLKRTYFRDNEKEVFFEKMQSDNKAIDQLNRAHESLKKENDVYNLTKEPVKWVVSTSPESVNIKINGCNKINYFDLIFALKNKKIKSLKELIAYLKSGFNMLDFYKVNSRSKQQKKYLKMIGLPVEFIDLEKLQIPVLAKDKSSFEQYEKLREIYNEAIEYYEKGLEYRDKFFENKLDSLFSELEKEKYKDAIKKFEQFRTIYPENILVLYHLANLYKKINDFDRAKEFFEKALEILPDEPLIMRDYARALISEGKYSEALNMLWQLFVKYSFVGDIAEVFWDSYKNIFKHNLINKKEKESINKKIKSFLPG